MANKQNSLCWYCKRSIDENYPCPWVDDGVPVKGWETSEMTEIKDSNIHFGVPATCMVFKCPLYTEYTNSITLSEYLNKIAEERGYEYTYAHSHPDRILQQYVAETGNPIPDWVANEMTHRSKRTVTRKVKKTLDK